MDVTNCKDINGNVITEIQFNEDGTVWGILEVEGTQTQTKLNYECCTGNGYTFDPTDAKCYWANTCETPETFKLILDPEGTDGVLFQVDETQEGNCTLEVQLDFILKIDCSNINDSLKNIIENLKLELSVEKVGYDENLPIPNTLTSIYKRDMISVSSAYDYLDGNMNTGFSLVGSNCSSLVQNLITDLGSDGSILNETSFTSEWVRFKMVIDDLTILESIYNEKIKIAILINDLTNFTVLVDNIKLEQVCEAEIGERYLKDECPKFDLNRVIDDKKSWVYNNNLENRRFDLTKRETNYDTKHERLVINTKEVDLLIKPSVAIENDLFNFTQENPCILSPATGCTSGSTSIECIDLSELMTTPIEELKNGTELLNQLIDVKNRKVLSSYPTINLLNYRYVNSQEHCGISSDALDNDTVNAFVDLVGAFWSDLIEQVVPSTTIWGTSQQYSDTNITSSTNKFVYRKSTMFLCETSNIEAPSPTNSTLEGKTVDVVTVDVTNSDYFGPVAFAPQNSTQKCSGTSIIQINNGSEFIGKVTVIGEGGSGDLSGGTITINETISDNCDTYNKSDCPPKKLGDFDPSDWDNDDWHTPNR